MNWAEYDEGEVCPASVNVSPYLRDAELAPRNTSRASASINGIVLAATNAAGNLVHQITKMEISQTCLGASAKRLGP